MVDNQSDPRSSDPPDNKKNLIAPELLADAPVGIYTTTPAGRFLAANRSLAKLLGYETADDLLHSITDLAVQVYADPEDRRQIKSLLGAYGEVRDYECQWLRRNGRKFWVSINARAIRDKTGGIAFYQGFASNITQRRNHEEALRKIEWMLSGEPGDAAAGEVLSGASVPPYGDLTALNICRVILDAVGEEALGNIVDDSLDMLNTSAAIYEKNGDYALGMFSSSWCRFMDQSSRRLCDTDSNEEALACGKWLCHESCWKTSKKCIDTGEPVDDACVGGIRLYAVPIYAKGEIIGVISFGYGNPPTERAGLTALASKYNVSAEALAVHANNYEIRPPYIIELAKRRIKSAAYLIGEIVGRRQSERSLEETVAILKEKTQLLQGITDSMFDMVSLTDMQGKYKFLGQSHKQLGYDLDFLVGKNILDFVHPDDYMRVSSVFAQFVANVEDEATVEYRYRCADGTYRWLETVGRFIRDVNGEPADIIFSTRDVTDRKHTEDLLRKREAFTRTVLDNLPIGLSINTVGDTVGFTYMNDNFPKMYRTTRDALQGSGSFWEIVYEDPVFREEIKQRVIADCATGDPERMQWNDIPFTRNGETYYICARNIPLPEEDLMISTVWDVTLRNRFEEKRRQALVKLRRRTKELESLFKGARSVMVGGDFATIARRLFDTARDITGARSGYVALVSENGEENEVLFLEAGGLECSVDPYLPMPIRGLRKEAFKTGQVVCDNDFMNGRWVGFMPDGHVPLKNVMFAPLIIEGRAAGVMGLANKDEDFTHEDMQVAGALGQLAAIALLNSRNLEALEQSEEKYRAILESVEDGYFEVDIAGNLTFFNDSLCRILGYPANELRGKNNREYMDGENAKKVFQAFNRVYETGAPVKAFDWQLMRKDGGKCHVDTSISAIRNADGGKIGFRGIVRDITERKKTEAEKEQLHAQLNQAQKMESVGRLAGGVAHDFNNMLTIINGYAEMMAEVLSPSDPMHESVKEIQDAGKRSAVIVRKLLAFARKQTISPAPMNLNDSVSSMLKMLERLIGENISLFWNPGKNIWLVEMDLSQIDQILANLVVNARDAIADTGKITIETKNVALDEEYCEARSGFVPGEFVMLAVSDNGCGMDAQIMENLFEPFFTTKEIGKGTGLGMPTVYGIVKQNNGFINVYSEPGQGTTVRIYFPRLPGDAEAPDKKKRRSIPKSRGEMVLVLEDEAVVLSITRKMLEKLGYTVLATSTPGEAMAMGETHGKDIDLLLTDIVMPEMNGRELANQLNVLYPNIKVLYMSGYTANVIAHHTILEDGLHFIEKPFSAARLAVKIREALDA